MLPSPTPATTIPLAPLLQRRDERVAAKAQRLHPVVEPAPQQIGAGRRDAVEERTEAIRNAVRPGHPAQIGLVPHALRFGEAELTEEEEGFTRRGRDPVRVAAPRVEELVGGGLALGLIFGVSNQLVLQLKGTELFESARAFHGLKS